MKNFNNSLKGNKNNCVCRKTPDNNEKMCPVDNNSIFFKTTCNVDNFDLSTKLWKQLSLSGDISFPCNKPLIEEIDSINTKIEILSQKVLKAPSSMNEVDFEGLKGGERIIRVYGLVCLSINYVGLLKTQQEFTFNGKIPFSAIIDLPSQDSSGVDTLNFTYIISSCIEDIHINSIIDRTLNITVTFILSATKSFNNTDFCNSNDYLEDSNPQCIEIKNCLNCDEENQIVFKGIFPQEKIEEILNIDENKKYRKRFISLEVLDLPRCNPNIVKILSITTNIKILCQKVIKTPTIDALNLENKKLTGVKLIVDFMLHQSIKYSSNTSCESIHSATFNYPASFYIVVPKETLLTDKFKISYYIDDIYACVLNERQIFKSVSIIFHAVPINCSKNAIPPIPANINVITFRGKENKEISTVGINIDIKKLTVTSSGEISNSDFGNKDYFSFELVDKNGASKIKETVTGNQNADNFRDNLNGKDFEEKDVIKLTYRDHNKVSISNYEGVGIVSISSEEANEYNPKYFSESYIITDAGLGPHTPKILSNIITLKREFDNKEILIIRFDTDNNSLIVDSSGIESNKNFKDKLCFSLEIKDSSTKSKIKSKLNFDQNPDDFRDALNGFKFSYDDILVLSYKNNEEVIITNFSGQSNYNPENTSESYIITPDGLLSFLPNVITFKGKDNEEIASVDFKKNTTSLVVTSSGIEANPDFSDQVYFSLEIKDAFNKSKIKSEVNGNQNADSFKSDLTDFKFSYGDVLTLEYKQNNKVTINNYEGNPNYNPSGTNESYEITPDGLKPIRTVDANTITFTGEDSKEFCKLNFDTTNNKLTVTSTGNKITPVYGSLNVLQLIFKNQRLINKNNLYVKGTEDATNFKNTFNNLTFSIGDVLRFRYTNNVSLYINNYRGKNRYTGKIFSENLQITPNGLRPIDFELFKNTIVLYRVNEPNEVVEIDFSKKGLKLFVNPSGGKVNNVTFRNKDYFRFILKERNGVVKQNQFIQGTQNAVNFSTALDEQRFNVNNILRLKYRKSNMVTITNFNNEEIYNPKFYSERYKITIDGLELLSNRMLQNIITFKGENNNEIVVLRFDITDKIFIADSSGLKANESLGSTEYFSVTLRESDEREKLKSIVNGNDDGDNLSTIFDEKPFNFGDILKLTYKENRKVEITNFDGQEVYNPSDNEESYLITENGLFALKKLLQNIITFRGRGTGDIGSIDRIEMASIQFDKTNMKLIVTSTGNVSNTQGTNQYFSFALLNSSGTEKAKFIVNANQNANDFANTLNETSFEYNDTITLEYVDSSRVDIIKFNDESVYHPTGSSSRYTITPNGLVKFK